MRTGCALPIAGLLAVWLHAQPQGRLLWSFEGNDGIYNAIAIPDVNGDGLPDAAAATYYGAYPSDPRKLYCCSGASGETIWVNRTAYGTWGNKGLDVSPDLNQDGYADILLGTAGGYTTAGRSVIAVSGRTGDTLWRYSRYQYWGWVYSVRTIDDIDGDSVPDALGGSGTTTDSAGAAVLVSGRTGQPIWLRRMYDDGVGSVAPFVDVNGDQVPDVLVGAGGNSRSDSVICLCGATGATVWRTRAAGSVSDVERIADVNRSGCDDVVAGGWDYSVYCLEGSTGQIIWSTPLGTARVVMEVVPIRDVNADGIDDVVVGSWSSLVTVLSGADGSTVWNGMLASDVWCVDTLGDVTGDNVPEVVAGCLGNGNGMVKVFCGRTGQALWQYAFSERVYDVTGAPDMNGDGQPDVLVGLQDQAHEPAHLLLFDGVPPAALLDTSEPKLGLYHDRASGRLCFEVVRPVRYRLVLYDCAGRETGIGRSGYGPLSQEVSLAGLAGGSYFAQLRVAGEREQTLKLVVPPTRRQ